MDYSTTIAETTQSRKLLGINLNKFHEVKRLSAIIYLLSYVKNILFEGDEGKNSTFDLVCWLERSHSGQNLLPTPQPIKDVVRVRQLHGEISPEWVK
ncbi:hypothetical protein [Limnofasciculus baicalensis]|uniref:Uncharacterized protein n=1 Tax=Limnofasciculus baicalensis BBK-W-15 TaxID=2699891 RepID=A0AAE3GNF7_9CYAN|nr:hypothetical protein [Limnofasciculus baicalensis]MCP2726983.1 hypothetical protein [Limnofasciculus baicalensis BBK-W-15]